MPYYSALATHLRSIGVLEGDWVVRNSGYEDDFAKAIGAVSDKQTHWDCVRDGTPIEVKKGKQHSWLNLIRYAEYVHERQTRAILTLFLFYEGKRVRKIYGVSMPKLLDALGMNRERADIVLELSERFPHKLNVQSRLTEKDIARVMDFEI